MRLDPANRDYRVRLEGVAVEPDRNVAFDLAEVDRIHARQERTAHRLFRDTVVLDQLQLPFGGCPAVTPHRCDDEWLGAEQAHLVDDSAHDLVDPVNTAASGRDRDSLSRAEAIADSGPAELGSDGGADVADLRRVEKLAQRSPARQRPALKDLEAQSISLRDDKMARRLVCQKTPSYPYLLPQLSTKEERTLLA